MKWGIHDILCSVKRRTILYAGATTGKTNKKKPKRSRSWSRRGVVSAVVLGALVIILLIAAPAFIVASQIRDLPRLEQEALSKPAQTTFVYAAGGQLIAKFHAEENRVIVPLDKIAPVVRNAVIAIEDERFYKHKGVDLEAIARSALVDIKEGRIAQGGSTITQQYVKNVLLTREKTFERKLKEVILSYEIEQIYSKDTILEKYLNTVYFGHGCYGVETAAQVFFGKSAADVTLVEAALLAAVIRSPGRNSPYQTPDMAIARRNMVLDRMVELKMVLPDEAIAAKALPIDVRPLKQESFAAPYFVEYVKQLLIDRYGVDEVFKGGLRVHTTVDLGRQQLAESAVFTTLDRPDDPEAALTAVDPRNGHILAMVGGRDFNEQKFNLASQGKRQPGSSFKTFVLAAAIESGISPSAVYASSPCTIPLPGPDWKVSNCEGGGGAPLTLHAATVRSVNAVFARLIMDVGAEKVVETAGRMGITTAIKPYPSIALGSADVSTLEMASAYGTLAYNGVSVTPIAILKVTDAKGNVIDEFTPAERQAIMPTTAFIVTDILTDVIRYGTGTRANIGRPAAGKTGTAQEYRDAWFAGYTPQISCAVWVGYKDAQISMRNVHGFSRVYGGTLPAIIWQSFMKKAHEGLVTEDFAKPKNALSTLSVCRESGKRATSFCTDVMSMIFPKGMGPTDECDIHTGIQLPSLVGMSEGDAATYLIQRGLVPTVQRQSHDTVPPGYVISHSPAAGTACATGSTVTLVISLGPEMKPKKPEPEEPETTETTPPTD